MPENTYSQNLNKPLKVNHLPMRILNVSMAIFILFLEIFSWSEAESWHKVLFSLLFFLCVLNFAMYGSTEMDNESVSHKSMLGQFVIKWDDVRRIETDIKRENGVIVFKGEGHRLVIPGKFFWSGNDKKLMWALMNENIKDKNIPVENNPWAGLKYSKKLKDKE